MKQLALAAVPDRVAQRDRELEFRDCLLVSARGSVRMALQAARRDFAPVTVRVLEFLAAVSGPDWGIAPVASAPEETGPEETGPVDPISVTVPGWATVQVLASGRGLDFGPEKVDPAATAQVLAIDRASATALASAIDREAETVPTSEIVPVVLGARRLRIVIEVRTAIFVI